ncbi:astacin-like metalloprotease toxin 5 isoform X2 [Amphiprion ocellaris]|uniref:astacin-like metalloprotease toxin 5 isoform X2 n=1 Tax=Amphiprion ocellaris TaxID=80972 RepID=UPI0024118CCB|nr:astacin-like metalloprotease toxin 5 isoform X2 [Amphiprion ocellaris]
MWFLVFICVSTVVGFPVGPTQHAATPVAAVTSVGAMLQSASTETLKVGASSLNDTHNASSPAPGTVALVLNPPQTDSAETLEELQEDMMVQEGDILLPEDRNAVKTIWSDATVYFTISKELAHRVSEIYAALKMIADATCIRFRKHTNELNYLKIRDGIGCASYVGCRGGVQSVFFGPKCSVGNLCHEIIHALGFHHEHTRTDRDQYITVNWQSIKPKSKRNFEVKHGDTLNLPYDLNSIMHYGQYFFSVDGSPTVLPRQSGVKMGQRTHLSQLDVQRLNKLYHCAERMKWKNILG